MPVIDTIIAQRYHILRQIGNGAIGTVYYAKREDGIDEELAIKLVPKNELRDSWQKEITKLLKLGNGRNDFHIATYRDHGFTTIDDNTYLWIATSWINGKTVKLLIEKNEITIPILLSIIKSALTVLHGCKKVNIQHGDLHAGNIIVEPPSSLSIEQKHTAYLIDFGYLTASMGKPMMDDYVGLSRIIQDALKVINFHDLCGEEKNTIPSSRGNSISIF